MFVICVIHKIGHRAVVIHIGFRAFFHHHILEFVLGPVRGFNHRAGVQVAQFDAHHGPGLGLAVMLMCKHLNGLAVLVYKDVAFFEFSSKYHFIISFHVNYD